MVQYCDPPPATTYPTHDPSLLGRSQLKEVATPEFKAYIQQVKRNINTLAGKLTGAGHALLTGPARVTLPVGERGGVPR